VVRARPQAHVEARLSVALDPLPRGGDLEPVAEIGDVPMAMVGEVPHCPRCTPRLSESTVSAGRWLGRKCALCRGFSLIGQANVCTMLVCSTSWGPP
jgi:hypothetical protein